MKKEQETPPQDTSVNTIKVGTFQLQTKSFWLGLVSILCLFMLAVIWLNSFYWYKMFNATIELNKTYVENVLKTQGEKK